MSTKRDSALQSIAELARLNDLSIDDIARAMGANKDEQPTGRATGLIARVLGYLGGILVLAGIALFIGLEWDNFSSAARVLVTLGAGFSLYVFALGAMTDPRFDRVIAPLLLVAAVLQPTGLLVLLTETGYDGDPQHAVLFMSIAMFAQQALTFIARRHTVLLFGTLFFGAASVGLAGDLLGVDHGVLAMLLGFSLSAAAWQTDQTPHRAIAAFWYFFGSTYFLGGAFSLLEGTAAEIVFFGLAAGVMYLATVVRSRSLLVVSVAALLSFTGYFFRDSLAGAFGLMVMGVLLIGLSALAMKLNRRYISSAGKGGLRKHIKYY